MNWIKFNPLKTLFFLVLFYDLTSFWGSSFTSNPEVSLGIKYAYVAGKITLIFLAVGILCGREKSLKAHPLNDSRSLDLLLILRAFACMLVIFGHYFFFTFAPSNLEEVSSHIHILKSIKSSPWVGVWIFFSLSGYLMGKGFFTGRYQLTKQDIRRFYSNRALRIIPVYVFVVLLVSILVCPQIFSAKYFWILLQIFIFDYKADTPIHPIGAIWSVSTEFQFYLMVPFLAAIIYYMRRFFTRPGILIGTVLVTGLICRVIAMIVAGDDWYPFIYTPFFSNIDVFFSAMLLSKMVQDKKNATLPHHNWGVWIAVWFLMVAGAVFVREIIIPLAGLASFDVHKSLIPDKALLQTMWSAITFVIIYKWETGKLQRLISPASGVGKIMLKTQVIGTLTYCIYVVHEPIYLFFRDLAPKDLAFWQVALYFPFLLSLIMFSAYLTYRFIELRFDRAKS